MESEKKKVSIEDVEVNTIYMMSQAMDLILRDVDRRMKMRAAEKGFEGGMKHEKKQLFKRYQQAVNAACILSEQLGEDVIESTAKKNYRDFPLWQDEYNELARLVLLYADKSSEDGAAEAIFGHLHSFRGAQIIDDSVLAKFWPK